ncbi:MAG: hypothetical protein GOP50_06275 [Candidatus Heimdallarchaeota archaeon]|nr:hypothetical protein [Candidatus Heimdallarchaeota archaeon]
MTDNDFVESEAEPNAGYLEQASEWSENMFYLLFELKKKYDKSLKNKEVVTVNESESDRGSVSDAFLYLHNEKESLVDAALYEGFIRMSELREKSFLDQMLHPDQRMGKLADIVKKLSTPITYFSRVSKFTTEEIVSSLDEQIIELASDEEIEQFINKYQQYVTKLANNFLSKGDIMNIEEIIIEKIIDKKIRKSEINLILTTVEAEILSKMISERKIIAVQEDEFLSFTLRKDDAPIKGISSSVLLSPKKQRPEGK